MIDSLAPGQTAQKRRDEAEATRPRSQRPQPPALEARRHYVNHQGLRLAMYVSIPARDAGNALMNPLLLVHSINAAASAAEVQPIFEHFATDRPVVALELPGFGSSDRPRIEYTPRLMRDSILRTTKYLAELGLRQPVDLIAVSLSCEFAARAALMRPSNFRSLAFVSPTGFESKRAERYVAGRTMDKPWLRWLLESGPWSDALFRMLTSEKSMRKFLERTWGSRNIDESLLDYNLVTVNQPGARHAPYAFVSGGLFTRGVVRLYAELTQPVWMIHGCMGEFARVEGLRCFVPAGHWTVQRIDTGAMPYFERPKEFATRYDAFLDSLDPV